MAINAAREMARHYREIADWLEAQAVEYETGKASHFRDGVNDTEAVIADLRHRARNLIAIVVAFERLDVVAPP